MKIVVSVNVPPNYISLLIVGGLKSVIFAVCFQVFINIACRSTQSAERIKRFLRLHIVTKPLIKNRAYGIPRNEMKRNEMKRNETKRNETKRND